MISIFNVAIATAQLLLLLFILYYTKNYYSDLYLIDILLQCLYFIYTFIESVIRNFKSTENCYQQAVNS